MQTYFLTKWLGPSDFGYSSLIFSYSVFVQYFLIFGYDQSLPYFIANGDRESLSFRKHLLVEALLTAVAFTIPILVIIGGVAFYFRDAIPENLFIPAFILGLQLCFLSLSYIFSGFLRYEKNFVAVIIKDQVFTSFSLLIFYFVFVKWLGMGLVGFSVAQAGTSIGSLIFAVIIYLSVKRTDLEKYRFDYSGWKKRFNYTLPIALNASIEPFLLQSFIFVSGMYLIPQEIGYISVCIKVSFLAGMAQMAISPIVLPYLHDARAQKQETQFTALYHKMMFICFLCSLVMVATIAVFRSEFLALFNIHDPVVSLALLLISFGLIFEGGLACGKLTLIVLGLNKFNFKLNLVFVPLAVLLTAVLSSNFGMIGTAASFCVTLMLSNLVRMYPIYKITGIGPFSRSETAKVIAVSILCVLAVLTSAVFQQLLFKVGMMAVIYLVIFIYALKNDIKSILRRA